MEPQNARFVIRPEEVRGGAPMERRPGVKDLKLIYPENGVPTRTLIMGIVEIAPGAHSPLHRHNCEEVYYVLQGRGFCEIGGQRYDIAPGYAVYNPPNVPHRTFNTGDEPLRLVVVGGIMFVGLLPEWPTPSPYEILEE